MSTLLSHPLRIAYLLLLFSLTVFAQEQQFAELGDFKLENGEVIRDCRIGYRTFGKLNETKSNAVIFPTWASGITEYLKGSIGPGKLVDSNRYFVIAVDALGNGVSSSPSNSKQQPRMSFPNFTLRDTVNTQYQLVSRVLKLSHVKAVIGISMGGMQAFQWLVSYPDFMELGIPIVGSPRLAPYDLLLWQSQLDGIMYDPNWNNGEYLVNPARIPEYEFGALLLTTPDHFNREMTREKVLDELRKAREAKGGGFDANDKVRQVQAMMALDVAAPYGGSMAQAASRIKAKVFVVVAKFDHVVSPGPAIELAQLIKARVLVLEGDCGHIATSCEANKLNPAVDEFLRQ
ncbi:MAG TPA: alpha/beta fold hydrolase [Pyrinomonadaceae bacterium]|nr:alpha/beta fold hydrolase [Pyrinomonadaceae bacterium]